MQWKEVEDHIAQAILLADASAEITGGQAYAFARAAIREMNAIRLRDVILGE